MPWFLAVLGCLVLAIGDVPSQVEEDQKAIPLVLTPAKLPVSGLRFTLLPELREQSPGNGATLYQKAGELLRKTPNFSQQFFQWERLPLAKLPCNEVRKFLTMHEEPLELLYKGARSEFCDFQVAQRLREKGLSASFDDLLLMRGDGAMLLCLKARLELAEDRPDLALRTLQTAYALARHVGNEPTLVCSLMSVAITNMANRVLELVLCHPKTPNLSASLMALPRLFIDLRRAWQGERLLCYSAFPGLLEVANNPNAGPLSPAQIEKMTAQFGLVTGSKEKAERLLLAAKNRRQHEAAKKALVATGRSSEQIDKWPPVQVALMHSLLEFDQLFDEVLMWQGLPYSQAAGPLGTLERKVPRHRRQSRLRRSCHPSGIHALPRYPEDRPESGSTGPTVCCLPNHRGHPAVCGQSRRQPAANSGSHQGGAPAGLPADRQELCVSPGWRGGVTVCSASPKIRWQQHLAAALRDHPAPDGREKRGSTMSRSLAVAGCLLLAGSLFAQPSSDPGPIRLVLTPARPPVPRLRFNLLPEVRDQTPGNGALYYRKAVPLLKKIPAELHQRATGWYKLPLAEWPRDEVRRALAPYKEVFDLLHQGARSERCDFEVAQQVREKGDKTLLGEVQLMRAAVFLLSLKARLELAEDRPDLALRTLQTAYSIGRQVGNEPTTTCFLDGLSVIHQANEVLELALCHPKTPNLSWSLVDLPHPFLDLRRALEGERIQAYATFPGLFEVARDLDAGPLSPELLEQTIKALSEFIDTSFSDRFVQASKIHKRHETAKQALVAAGRPRATIEKWPLLQVALMHSLLEYDQVFDDVLQCQGFPYQQARVHLCSWTTRSMPCGSAE